MFDPPLEQGTMREPFYRRDAGNDRGLIISQLNDGHRRLRASSIRDERRRMEVVLRIAAKDGEEANLHLRPDTRSARIRL